MTDEEIASLFEHLYQRSIVNLVTIEKRPSLLAHYTSLEVLEKIMTNEIWFSNPLFMNDLQEVRFGMGEGLKAFNEFARTPQFLEACGGSQEKAEMIRRAAGTAARTDGTRTGRQRDCRAGSRRWS